MTRKAWVVWCSTQRSSSAFHNRPTTISKEPRKPSLKPWHNEDGNRGLQHSIGGGHGNSANDLRRLQGSERRRLCFRRALSWRAERRRGSGRRDHTLVAPFQPAHCFDPVGHMSCRCGRRPGLPFSSVGYRALQICSRRFRETNSGAFRAVLKLFLGRMVS